jgi:hypothetical protein
MRRWFLSYHSPDEAKAERLKAAIERKNEGAIVFFAPTNLRVGGRWAPALAESIAEATAFVLLATDKGVGRWREIEYDAAFGFAHSQPSGRRDRVAYDVFWKRFVANDETTAEHHCISTAVRLRSASRQPAVSEIFGHLKTNVSDGTNNNQVEK